MEPAKIEWNKLEWRFVEDELYEHISAPKWFDFLSPQSNLLDHHHNDDAWFCRPDCNHPKTPQDFYKSPLTPSKLPSPIGVSEMSFSGQRKQRDPKGKRRVSPIGSTKFNSDSENQDPNRSNSPPSIHNKASIFEDDDDGLKAKNLFASRDILTHITEFCNDLKRMALKTREQGKEFGGVEVSKPITEQGNESRVEILSEKKKKKPLGSKRDENNPLCVKIENQNSSVLQIRTNPPSPQCFSSTRKATPSKSKLLEKGTLQEQNNNKHIVAEKNNKIVESREPPTKALDVFWFLKPCTMSTYNSA